MKRFWQQATVRPVDGAWEILLDERPLNSPARKRLRLPTLPLADAIASEWRQAPAAFQPSSMPMTALANAAIDIVAANRDAFLEPLVRYAAFDLLCYRAAAPAALVARQADLWEPILAGVEQRHQLTFRRANGLLHVEQPAASLDGVRAIFSARSDFELAALHPIVTIGGSAALALAHLDGAIGAEEAFAASHLDESFQQQQWGADDEALRVRALRRGEFLAAADFLALTSPEAEAEGDSGPHNR